ncbi:MAG TPA: hypothetical protein VF691_08305 [Cytophagaceae bacterium]
MILLDINIPHLNGLELLERFYKVNFNNWDAVKVVVLTTSTNEGDFARISQFTNRQVAYSNKPLTIKN